MVSDPHRKMQKLVHLWTEELEEVSEEVSNEECKTMIITNERQSDNGNRGKI